GRDSANWGIMGRYDIQSAGVTLGAYYREFDDYQAWLSPRIDMGALEYRLVYPRNVKLFGLSYAGNISSASIGAEISRSEEHTSELQSRENLVCRLLLEKKN